MSEGEEYEAIEGYSYEGPDGVRHDVPPMRMRTEYRHEAMSRDEADDIVIAFGVVGLPTFPISLVAHGKGFDVILPVEFLRELPGVRRQLKVWGG